MFIAWFSSAKMSELTFIRKTPAKVTFQVSIIYYIITTAIIKPTIFFYGVIPLSLS